MHKNSLIMTVIVSLLLVFTVLASNNSGTDGMGFLKLGSDARGNSLAGSVIADVRSIDSLYWNPGGLCFMQTVNIMATYLSWPGDMAYYYFAAGIPFLQGKAGVLAAGITFLNEGGLDQATTTLDLASLASYDLAASLAYALKLGPLYFGGAVRYINQKIMSISSVGMTLDLGGQFLLNAAKTWKLGIVIKNIGFSTKYNISSMPVMTDLGLGYRKVGKNNNSFSFNFGGEFGNDSFLNTGLEFGIHQAFFFRLGYSLELANASLSFPKGLGMGIGAFITTTSSGSGISADVTWVPMAELGTSLQTTVKATF